MNKKAIIGGVIIIVLGLLVYFGMQGGVGTKGPITLGFIGPLTGDAANIGQSARIATEFAVEEINAAGGIDGRELSIVYEDGACSGKDASSAANKLIHVDGVPVIIGGLCSGETLSFTGAAEQSGTVVLSYCSSAPAISQAGDYIFRNYPSDSYQGVFTADYVKNTLGVSNVAILFVKSDWGNGIKDVFVEEFERLGGSVVIEEGYDQTSRDLRTHLTKVKAAEPELLYFLGYTEASIPGITQARELGLDIPLFGGDAWGDSTIWESVGEAGEGAMYSVVNAPLNDAFRSEMRARTGSEDITVCAPQVYDAVHVVADVIEKVGVDAEAIKNDLYSTVYYGGVSSEVIDFDENGDLEFADYLVQVVRDGRAVDADTQ